MLLFGFILMTTGLIMGLVSIHKAAHRSISPVVAGWMCYGGIFVALLGSVLVGKVM